MNARQDWEKGTLILKPPGQKPGEVIVYNMKDGKQKCLEEETSEESESSTEPSSSTSGSTSQSSSEGDSLAEICRVTLREPGEIGSESLQKELKDEDMEKMLAKDLSATKKEEFKVMLRKHLSLFISDYGEITGVTAVQHQINLKPNQKPVA